MPQSVIPRARERRNGALISPALRTAAELSSTRSDGATT
jgi:hypothetical protein